jgi:hypothetical protein
MRLVMACSCGLLACTLPPAASATDGAAATGGAGPAVIASAGTFALVEQFDYPYLLGLQYRSTPRTSWALMPGIGIAGGPDGLGFLYADVAHDFALPRRWTMTLSLAGGLFINGDAIGVKEHLEFQSGIAFSRRLENGARLGLAGYHISNGGLEHPNNGSEALVLFLELPVRRSR